MSKPNGLQHLRVKRNQKYTHEWRKNKFITLLAVYYLRWIAYFVMHTLYGIKAKWVREIYRLLATLAVATVAIRVIFSLSGDGEVFFCCIIFWATHSLSIKIFEYLLHANDYTKQ